MARRLVVIGGVAAGLSAAGRAKRLEPDLEVTVFERSGYCAYTACGLPYLVGGVVHGHRDLVVRSAEAFAREGVEVRVEHEVVDVDLDRRAVSVVPRGGSPRAVPFDALLLATGARPVARVPGLELDGCFVVRTIEDALAINEWIASARPRRGVIVGAGYIGLEMAEALHRRGIATTVIEGGPEILPLVDADIAETVAAELRRHEIAVLTGSPVEAVEGDRRVRGVQVDGAARPAEIVILGIGVRPDSALAEAAGIPLGPHAGVRVDPGMRTGIDGVWAAGDCCQTRHLLHGEEDYIPLGTTANKQGRVAGATIAGRAERFAGVMGTAVLKVCDLEVGRTGLTAAQARAAGLHPVEATVEHRTRAGYYPGGRPITVKLVAERASGRLLGGQLTGGEGVAKRVDVLAAALHGGATAADLAGYDLSYAPPFAPVWDPVLLAARQAAKIV